MCGTRLTFLLDLILMNDPFVFVTESPTRLPERPVTHISKLADRK